MQQLMDKLEYYMHFFGYAKDESSESLNTHEVGQEEECAFDDEKLKSEQSEDKQKKNNV